MATIGTFKPTATGFEGTIATLMVNKKVRFVANEKKKAENSPDFFVKSGCYDLGVAWNDVTEPQDDAVPLEYISVKLDCLEMTKPINAAMFHRDDGRRLRHHLLVLFFNTSLSSSALFRREQVGQNIPQTSVTPKMPISPNWLCVTGNSLA